MEITGAVIREQGVTFAVVIVKEHVVRNPSEARDAIAGLVPVFRVPVVLMAEDSGGRPTYYGRTDIARFLSSISPGRIPWKKYTIN